MSAALTHPQHAEAGLPAIPSGWTDVSWVADECPSYRTPGGHIVSMWFPDFMPRPGDKLSFTVWLDEADLFETQDWDAVLAFIAKAEGGQA